MTTVAIYGGSRPGGNSELLAAEVLKDVEATAIFLRDYTIQPVVDQRHQAGGFSRVDDDFDQVIDTVLCHERWLFVTPVYWYGMSGLLKNFIDRWSQASRDLNLHFGQRTQGKTAYLVAAGGDNPRIKALALVQQFFWIADFVGLTLADYVIGEGDKPGDVLNDSVAMVRAGKLRGVFKESRG